MCWGWKGAYKEGDSEHSIVWVRGEMAGLDKGRDYGGRRRGETQGVFWSWQSLFLDCVADEG